MNAKAEIEAPDTLAAGESLDESVLVPAGTLLDGIYRVDHEIGRGGMGAVYEVEHVALGKKFAAKVMSRHVGTSGRERLRTEARVTGALQHENIVRVTHLGETSTSAPYVVMELLEGESLGGRMHGETRPGGRRAPIPDEEARVIVEHVLAGLVAAHGVGIVHRDLKPDNIFLERRGDATRAKIVDFGIAKRLDSLAPGITREGQIMGTPLYMPPEQAHDVSKVDARADLYAMGCISYEMLTGGFPFEMNTAVEAILAHGSIPPTPIQTYRPDIDDAVARVVHRALEKRPEDRFESAGEMLDAWRAAWGGEAPATIVTTPTSDPSHHRTPAYLTTLQATAPSSGIETRPAAPVARRRRLLVGGAALLGLCVLGVGAWTMLGSESAPVEAVAPVSEPPPPPEPLAPPENIVAVETVPDASPAGGGASQSRDFRIVSRPPGAHVFRDGEELGITPLDLSLDIAEPVALEIRHRGYRSARLTLGPDGPRERTIRLRRRGSATDLAPL